MFLSQFSEQLKKLQRYDTPILPKFVYRLKLDLEEEYLKKTQYWDLDKIRAGRQNYLKKILAYAYERVPLYRGIYKDHAIDPQEIKTEEDMIRLPLITKQMFMKRAPSEIIASRIHPKRIIKDTTSGSTGEPFRYFTDQKFSPARKANLYRVWRWAGVEPTAPTVHCSAPHAAAVTPNTVFLHPHFIKANIDEYIEKIHNSGAMLIRGYPITNLELARAIKARGCTDIKFSHAFFVGHAISKGLREFFKKELNCEVYGYYATRETGPVAAECERHYGYHIHEERLIVEIVNEKGNKINDGVIGKIAVTSFMNEVMPLIRYSTGDAGMVIPGKCPCGRTSRRLLVEGRTEDMFLRPDGQFVYPGILRDILDDYFFAFERYQMTQISLDSLHLKIVATPNFKEVYLKKVLEKIEESVGHTMRITAEAVAEIPPLLNGKYQYFVSDPWRQKFSEDFFDYEISGIGPGASPGFASYSQY